MKTFLFRSLSILAFIALTFPLLSAQAWTLLGSRKVNGYADHDEISVTASRGDFKAIKLFVQNEGIDFDRLAVHYGNGQVDRMDIKNYIPAGGETRVMDLAGADRVIKKVVVYYKSNPNTPRKGKVLVYGRR